MGSTPASSQAGDLSRHQAPHAATAASFNPRTDVNVQSLWAAFLRLVLPPGKAGLIHNPNRSHGFSNSVPVAGVRCVDVHVIPTRVKADSFWGFQSGASQIPWWRTGGSPCGQG